MLDADKRMALRYMEHTPLALPVPPPQCTQSSARLETSPSPRDIFAVGANLP